MHVLCIENADFHTFRLFYKIMKSAEIVKIGIHENGQKVTEKDPFWRNWLFEEYSGLYGIDSP